MMKRGKIEKVIKAAMSKNFIKESDLALVVHNVEIEIEETNRKAIDKLESKFLEDLAELTECTTIDENTQSARPLTQQEIIDSVESMFHFFVFELDEILNE